MTTAVLRWNEVEGFVAEPAPAARLRRWGRAASRRLLRAAGWTAGLLLAPFVALPVALALLAAWPSAVLFGPAFAAVRAAAFLTGAPAEAGAFAASEARRGRGRTAPALAAAA